MFRFGERLLGDGAELFLGEQRRALVVEAPAVGGDVVEPDVVGAAGVGLGEEEDGGGDAGVGFEDAAGERDHGVELLLLHQKAAQLLVGLAGAEEDAVGHDDGGAAAGLEQAQEQGEKEQLRLLGLDDLQEVLGGVLVVQGAGEGRIGQDEGVALLVVRVVLGQRVAVADVGVLHAVEEHVHRADAEHGVVEVEAVEQALVEVLLELWVVEEIRIALAQVLAGGDEKARRAAGRVAEDVVRRGRGHLDHEADDVARGAELAVLAGGGDLAEHVFVEVALGVAVLHRHLVEQVHHLGQERRGGDGEAGVLHVVGVGGAVAAQRAQEGEDVLVHDGEHVGRGEILETRPAQVLVGAALGVVSLGKDAPLHRLFERGGFVLLQRVQVVQPPQEEQVGDLLDDFERVGDPPGPEGVPDAVDLIAEFTGEHGWYSVLQSRHFCGSTIIPTLMCSDFNFSHTDVLQDGVFDITLCLYSDIRFYEVDIL